ncbi:NPP1 family protein [Pendulispora rubella]|uniref:NPP1 family protein n=1 Tax=Pendulispora rubella TaxID=2741070 RepID=A0ABZ2KZQ7_9BACT
MKDMASAINLNPSVTSSKAQSTIRRLALTGALGALAVVPAFEGVAHADVLQRLDQSAGQLEQTFAPTYDYDKDSCYVTAAIDRNGRLNPGLKPGGVNESGHCHDRAQLDNANHYSRGKCNNGWCGIVYANYFEKDQVAAGPAAHRHDWEHVVVWINQGANQVQYVSVSQHSGYETRDRSRIRFDGSHPKIVYHKDGPRSHAFRFANESDDRIENVTGHWFYPWLVDYSRWPSTGLRDTLMNSNFGAATIKITDKDDRFKNALRSSKPGGIPFNPDAN